MFQETKHINFQQILMIALLPLFFPGTGNGQTGLPYITYFESQERYERYNWSVCQDDHNTMLFANKKGLRSYDGSDWHYIGVPQVPLKISRHPRTGVVYVLSAGSAGYLQRDHKGIRQYVSLLDEGIFEDHPSSIFFTGNLVVIHGKSILHAIDSRNQQVAFSHQADSGIHYAGMVELDGTLYTLIKKQGLFRVESDRLIPAGIEAPDNEDEILFAINHPGGEVLTGMGSGRLWLFDGNDFSPFPISNENYLLHNELSEGVVLNDTTYVFSTRYGGAILVNKENGKVINTLNYENGLPDDEIYAIAVDNFQGLWLTYRFGICRLDLTLPVRDFSSYPGLEGLYTGVLFQDNKLYISTTTGLYALSEVKNYEEVDVYIRRDPPPVTDKKSLQKEQEGQEEELTMPVSEEEEEQVIEEEEEKKGFFTRLFRRKSKEVGDESEETRAETIAAEEEPEAKPEAKPKPEAVVAPQPQYVKRTISRLKSIEHVYKKVEGIPGNCQQLVSTKQGILAGTSSGLYILNDDRAELISSIRNINFISGGVRNSYLVIGDNEIAKVNYKEGEWIVDLDLITSREPLFSASETDSFTIWVSGLDVVYCMTDLEAGLPTVRRYEFESVYPEELSLAFIDDTLFLFSESMVQYYLQAADSFLLYSGRMAEPDKYSSIHLFPSTGGDHWIRMDNRILPFSIKAAGGASGYEVFNLFQNISSFHSGEENIYWVIDDFSGIYRIDLSEKDFKKEDFAIFPEQISNESGTYYFLNEAVFDPSEKVVTVRLTAPYYLKDNSTQFQYLIEDRMDQWSEWAYKSSFQLITAPGTYRVKVRARNVLGDVSDPEEITFSVRTPFYETPWFYVILLPVFFGLLFLVIYARERKLRHDNLILEQKIEERTREIQVQKEQIENQKNEILAQKNDITSSITYASKIQNAVLPDRKLFDKVFKDYFIFYRPRDIVSGDFYWITHSGKKTIFTVADCTGHGVPGAFMSMLGNSFLNEIIRTSSFSLSPDQILNQLRDKISEALAQSGEQSSTHDGMDIALCIYDSAKSEIQFSGAYNSLYLVRDGKLLTVKGDMMPIGYYPNKKDFTSHRIAVSKGDILYLFSDGFSDQFGGPMNKKYTIGRFKKLLVTISEQPMKEQQRTLDATLKSWSEKNIQVDDVLVMGVEF